MVYLFYFLFYERNNTKMRQSYELPQDDGSRRSRCPPSHQEMALTPHYAQASARAPRPSPPSTHSLASTDKVSPHHPSPTGEHKAAGCPSGTPYGTCGPTRIRGPPGPHGWVNGTLAHVFWGVNAILFPSHQLRDRHEHEGGIYPDDSIYSAVG